MEFNFRAIGHRPAGVHSHERVDERVECTNYILAKKHAELLESMWGMTVVYEECEDSSDSGRVDFNQECIEFMDSTRVGNCLDYTLHEFMQTFADQLCFADLATGNDLLEQSIKNAWTK